jgi:hypothetical protein
MRISCYKRRIRKSNGRSWRKRKRRRRRRKEKGKQEEEE